MSAMTTKLDRMIFSNLRRYASMKYQTMKNGPKVGMTYNAYETTGIDDLNPGF